MGNGIKPTKCTKAATQLRPDGEGTQAHVRLISGESGVSDIQSAQKKKVTARRRSLCDLSFYGINHFDDAIKDLKGKNEDFANDLETDVKYS